MNDKNKLKYVPVLRSLDYLHPKLRAKAYYIQGDLDHYNNPIKIFETGRTLDRQKYILQEGYTKTLKSDHIIMPEKGKLSKAFDGVVRLYRSWSWDYKKYKKFYDQYGKIVKSYDLIWGGDWKSFKDYPHAQLKDDVR